MVRIGAIHMEYKVIVDCFEKNPHDVCTVPLNRKEPLWFYVFVKNNELWVERAKSHRNSSSLTRGRVLKESECETMIDIYQRRKDGEAVSKEATVITRNQVYWYGIFSDLGL